MKLGVAVLVNEKVPAGRAAANCYGPMTEVARGNASNPASIMENPETEPVLNQFLGFCDMLGVSFSPRY